VFITRTDFSVVDRTVKGMTVVEVTRRLKVAKTTIAAAESLVTDKTARKGTIRME
jgi:hypothetical protein